MSQPQSGQTQALRRHFDEREWQRVDLLMDKFAQLLGRGLTSRKLEKWASVVHFRMTQLSTVEGFGLPEHEVASIKRAYFHAHGKAEREADKILVRNGIDLRRGERSSQEAANVAVGAVVLNAELRQQEGEEAYSNAALRVLEPEHRPAIPDWASALMDDLFPLLIPQEAGERWSSALVEQAIATFALVVSEDWTTVERRRVEEELNAGLNAMCDGGDGAGPPPTLLSEDMCARCAAGMLTRHRDGEALRRLVGYLEDQPAWQRLGETGLLGSGIVAQLAAAGRLLEGTEKELFENANAQAVRIGEAVGFVVVLQALGYTSSMGAER